MIAGKFAIELAEARVDHERDVAVARVRARLRPGLGSACCDECGAEIPAARRAAVPAARLCVDCAADRERRVN